MGIANEVDIEINILKDEIVFYNLRKLVNYFCAIGVPLVEIQIHD